jgi:hypothetical protein
MLLKIASVGISFRILHILFCFAIYTSNNIKLQVCNISLVFNIEYYFFLYIIRPTALFYLTILIIYDDMSLFEQKHYIFPHHPQINSQALP